MKGNIKSKDDIPNLLGFIAQTQKTGVLTLVNKGEQIEIGFIKGNVNAAVYKRSGVQELIKEYLINSGKITNKDFKKIQMLHKETKKSYEEILVSEKYINTKQWEDIIQFKIQEIMDELFTWENGTYEFIEDIIMYKNSTVKISLNTQGLIMEGMRRIDEWPQIKNLLSSTELYFEKSKGKQLPDNIGMEERRLYEIIEPSKSLGMLIKTSGLGKFLTYQSVYNLLKLGVIKKTIRKRPIRKAPARKKIAFNIKAIFVWLIIIFIIAGTGIAGRLLFNYTMPFIYVKETTNKANIDYNKERVEYALKVYYFRKWEYPEKLEQLVKIKWLDKNIINSFSYIKTKNSYKLFSSY